MLRQAHPPLARLLGIAVAAFLVLVMPAVAEPNPIGSASALRLENAQLEAKSRSAVLSLYSLDLQLTAARARLSAVRGQLAALRTERATLRRQLKIARAGEAISERQLATRLRQLYDQGEVSPIEVVFGATSITDAMTQLDNIHRVASLNDDVLAQLRTAQSRLLTTSQKLAARTADVGAALRTAAATESSLSRTRAERSSYIASLAARRDLNAAQIARLEVQARAAQTLSQQLTVSTPAATPAPVQLSPGGRTLVARITGYSLPGFTASGIPVGWGVAATDPRVIPLGTHIWVPGYGDAIAADVGSAIVGDRIDIWFPTLAQAQAWGFQTLTISVT